MNAVTLYLVRHGAIIKVEGKVFIGQSAVPLSDEGVDQAWALRKLLEPVHFSRYIASDLSRSLRTAKIIAGRRARSVEPFAALREINLGDWEGYPFQQIRARYPDEYAARGRDLEHWRPPHGESFADCHARVSEALHSILAHSTGNVLLAGHAGVNRLILCSALGIPVQKLFNLAQDYGCINILQFASGRARVQLINYVPLQPLQSERAPAWSDAVLAGLPVEVESRS